MADESKDQIELLENGLSSDDDIEEMIFVQEKGSRTTTDQNRCKDSNTTDNTCNDNNSTMNMSRNNDIVVSCDNQVKESVDDNDERKFTYSVDNNDTSDYNSEMVDDPEKDLIGSDIVGVSCDIQNENSDVLEQESDLKGLITREQHQKLINERDMISKELQSTKEKESTLKEVIRQLEEKCFVQQEKIANYEDELMKERTRAEGNEEQLKKTMNKLSESQQGQEIIMTRVNLLDQEKIKILEEQVSLERRRKDDVKEIEKLQTITKSQKTEISKLTISNEKYESQVSEQTKELKKLRDDSSSHNIKLKWAQNKLKSELEAHKETKGQLTSTTKKLKEAREEGEQIRQDLKRMIAQYQDSEEMKSNTLDVKLRKREEELRLQEQEIADQTQLHELTVKELELSRDSLEVTQKECGQLKTRVTELTNQITEKQSELDDMKVALSKEKREQKRLCSEIEAMKEMNKDIVREREAHTALRESHVHLQKTNQHLEKELGKRKEKESELLTFSEKLSSSNAQLMTEKGVLEGKLSSLEVDICGLRDELRVAHQRREEQENELSELQQTSHSEISVLMNQLQDKSKAVEQLSISLEEEREQISALKRKHANNIRDMQRQIQLYTKRIEQLEASNSSAVATLPVSLPDSNSTGMGIRSVSHGSLDDSRGHLHVTTYPYNRMSSPEEPLSPTLVVQSRNSSTLFQTLDHEKTVLVEKICQLKRTIARREEKLEFYEGHSQQLLEDLKKKSRIIQNYIMRDQAGALATPEADAHKEKFRRKSGIMASVFSGSAQKISSDMTLELSIEINRKMQAVLEDTLLKNITLKESLETLGQEIAFLSSQLNIYQKSSSQLPR